MGIPQDKAEFQNKEGRAASIAMNTQTNLIPASKNNVSGTSNLNKQNASPTNQNTQQPQQQQQGQPQAAPARNAAPSGGLQTPGAGLRPTITSGIAAAGFAQTGSSQQQTPVKSSLKYTEEIGRAHV